MKYQQDKILNLQNNHKKNSGPKKYPQEKILNCKKIFRIHETPLRKNFRTLKYSQEKISNPRNSHNKKFPTHKILSKKNLEL